MELLDDRDEDAEESLPEEPAAVEFAMPPDLEDDPVPSGTGTLFELDDDPEALDEREVEVPVDREPPEGAATP